jgi:hypothetical protein
MKTLRLNRAESAAYANGERRFWRAMRKQPDERYNDTSLWYPDRYNKTDEWCFWGKRGTHKQNMCGNPFFTCPYGKPDDRIEIIAHGVMWYNQHRITRVEVEQRDGRWGWVVEVGA